jgi:hypothetical protein
VSALRCVAGAVIACLVAADAAAQASDCLPAPWTQVRLEELKRDGFKLSDALQRQELARALPACLGHANPALRDGIAFEALSSWLRGGQLDHATLRTLRRDLLIAMAAPDAAGFRAPFAALVLSEVARTDRLAPWMTTEERDELIRGASMYLAAITDYRAFDDTEGFRHGVAHGADLVLQLALNPVTSKTQLDQLIGAVASQVSPNANVAYWAGEPDRLARPIVFIAQRKLHADSEWQELFGRVSHPRPLESWQAAFTSESGIKKRHNVRAFLLSVYASASSSDDPGVRQLLGPVTAALKTVP